MWEPRPSVIRPQFPGGTPRRRCFRTLRREVPCRWNHERPKSANPPEQPLPPQTESAPSAPCTPSAPLIPARLCGQGKNRVVLSGCRRHSRRRCVLRRNHQSAQHEQKKPAKQNGHGCFAHAFTPVCVLFRTNQRILYLAGLFTSSYGPFARFHCVQRGGKTSIFNLFVL